MDIFDELAHHTGHTNHELGVAAGPASTVTPHTPRPRLTRRQVRDIARPLVERRGGTLTTIDGRSLTAILADGHVEIRPGLEVVAFSGAGDTTGEAIGLCRELREAFKEALKARSAVNVTVRHNGHPGPRAQVVEAAIVAACPAPVKRGFTPVWDGSQWAIYWYSDDHADVRCVGAGGFRLEFGAVGPARTFVGDFDGRCPPVPAELIVVRDAVAAALADRRAA